MVFYTLLGGTIIVGLAMIHNANGTVKLVVAVITVRGLTWLCQKITGSINKDASDMINFAGWSLAGISIVGIINYARLGVKPVTDVIGMGSKFVDSVGLFCDKIGRFVDGVTFWN